MDFALDTSELEFALAQADEAKETVMLVEQQPTTPICECFW
ncbi:hypothetical protein [Stenotrophomonas sp. G106K1]